MDLELPPEMPNGLGGDDEDEDEDDDLDDSYDLTGAYRGPRNGLYVVGRNFFLLLLNCSAWPCLGPA